MAVLEDHSKGKCPASHFWRFQLSSREDIRTKSRRSFCPLPSSAALCQDWPFSFLTKCGSRLTVIGLVLSIGTRIPTLDFPKWEWTGWDLNPGLPACKAGDLPLIYRPRRAHSVAAQMKLSATFRRSDRDAYPITRDEGGMGPGAERLVQWFVGLSLLVGGLVLLAGAIQFGTLGGPIWVIPLAGVVAAALAGINAPRERGPRSPLVPPS